MNELKIYVEQIVRPLRATRNRKFQLRMELYAHLEEQFHLEQQQSVNQQQALLNTVNRFGSPDQLTEELQQTISLSQRCYGWFEMWLKRKKNESLFFFSGRISLFAILSSLLYGVILILLIQVFSAFFSSEVTTFKHISDKLVEGKWFMGATLICLAVNTFTFTCISNLTFNHVKNARIRISLPISLLAGLLCAFSFVSSICLMFLALLEDPLFTSELTLSLCLSLFWIPLLYLIVMQVNCWEWRKFAPWESLDLPEAQEHELTT